MPSCKMATPSVNYIYVLKLSEGKYYVGKSDNVIARFQSHLTGNGNGAEWTKKYPPLLLIECYESKNIFDEDNKTKEYMMKYGFDNVRGGSYSKFELTIEDLNTLKKEFAGSMGLCFNCGRSGHYVSECSLKVSRHAQSDRDASPPPLIPAVTQVPVGEFASSLVREVCKRCGSNTHTNLTCNARMTIDGKAICRRCGRTTHTTDKCKLKTDYTGKKL